MQWTRSQKNVVVAAYLGWTLDAFDFFLMVFMFKDIASTFHVDVKNVAEAVFLTLAARPIGAFVFGQARGPVRPQAHADVEYSGFLDPGGGFRLCALADVAFWSCDFFSASPWEESGASGPP